MERKRKRKRKTVTKSKKEKREKERNKVREKKNEMQKEIKKKQHRYKSMGTTEEVFYREVREYCTFYIYISTQSVESVEYIFAEVLDLLPNECSEYGIKQSNGKCCIPSGFFFFRHVWIRNSSPNLLIGTIEFLCVVLGSLWPNCCRANEFCCCVSSIPRCETDAFWLVNACSIK